jgi:hypothetical protein
MTKDEALDLALEALLRVKEEFSIHQMDTAITAIKQALAAPVQEPVGWMNPHGGFLSASYIDNFASGLDKEIHNIPVYTTPPAQPAPVPKGWKLVPIKPTMQMVNAIADTDPERESIWEAVLAATSPAAQRQWVGLTDKDISDALPSGIYDCLNDPWDCGFGDGDTIHSIKKDVLRISRAIEAKLKEKNA